MKKVITALLSAIAIIGISVPTFAEDINKEKSTTDILTYAIVVKDTIDNNLIIEGKNIEIGKLEIKIKNGQVMVPAKVTAEDLGFKVDIDKNNQIVSLDNDKIKTQFKVGLDSYYYASSHLDGCIAPVRLGVAPMVIDNIIYVPIKVCNLLFNDSKAVGSFWSRIQIGQFSFFDKIYIDNGDLTLGWKLINNKWYFMNSNGIMQRGWVQTNGNWYYLYNNGEMASDTITPDGYKIDQSGKWDLGQPISNYIDPSEMKI